MLCNEVEQVGIMKGGIVNLLVKHESILSVEKLWVMVSCFDKIPHSMKKSWMCLGS